MADLAQAAEGANVEAELRVTGIATLGAIHLHSTRWQLPYVVAFMFVPGSQPGRSLQASATTGSWVGQEDAGWRRTLCKLQIQGGVADPQSAADLAVRAWTFVASAEVARKLLRDLAGTVQLQRLEILDERTYSAKRSHGMRYFLDDISLVPEDHSIPRGCEPFALTMKGIRTADTRGMRLNPGATRLLLAQLAAEMPDRPVELELAFPLNARFREITELVGRYDIERLRANLMWVPEPPNSANVILRDYDFASDRDNAPSYRLQMDRAVCRLKIQAIGLVRPATDGRSLEIVVPPRQAQVRVLMRAGEAKRLIDELPGPVTDAMVSRLPPGYELESARRVFGVQFAEPIHAGPGTVVPEECRRFVGTAR